MRAKNQIEYRRFGVCLPRGSWKTNSLIAVAGFAALIFVPVSTGLAPDNAALAQAPAPVARIRQRGEKDEFPGLPFAEEFSLINASPDLLGMNSPSPVALVRVVNYLHGLGKDRAIEVLREYVKYAPAEESSNQKVASQQRLLSILPLLFVPLKADAELPPPFRRPETRGEAAWQPIYFSLEGDLPFHKENFGGRTGMPDPARGYLVEWADKHARLRDKPLHPSDDPLKAADALCQTLLKDNEDQTGAYAEGLKMHMRQQARRSIEHLFPAAKKKRWSEWVIEDEWQPLKDAAAKLKIRWDEKGQAYTVD